MYIDEFLKDKIIKYVCVDGDDVINTKFLFDQIEIDGNCVRLKNERWDLLFDIKIFTVLIISQDPILTEIGSEEIRVEQICQK